LVEGAELIDSHFSERGRQGRLMVIAMQASRRWAFGVDEDTAYVWTSDGGRAVISGTPDGRGVVIFENTEGTAERQTAMMHFLTPGDSINDAGEIIWGADKVPCPAGAAPAGSSSVFDASGRPYRTISIAAAQAPVGTLVENYHGNPAVQINFEVTGATVAMCGPTGNVGFAGLFIQQFSAATDPSFVNTQAPALDANVMLTPPCVHVSHS
jgi:hypothetical protein